MQKGLTFAVGFASSSPADEEGRFDTGTVVQSVNIMGVKSKPSTVSVHEPGENNKCFNDHKHLSSTLNCLLLKIVLPCLSKLLITSGHCSFLSSF